MVLFTKDTGSLFELGWGFFEIFRGVIPFSSQGAGTLHGYY